MDKMESERKNREVPPFLIHIVDDDPLHGWFWRRTLENRYGNKVRIEVFQDAGEAITSLNEDVGLVLLDWHMPHLDAKAFLEKAGAKGIGTDRFILFSGSDRSLTEEAFGSFDFLAVVEKGRVEEEERLLRLLDGLVSKS